MFFAGIGPGIAAAVIASGSLEWRILLQASFTIIQAVSRSIRQPSRSKLEREFSDWNLCQSLATSWTGHNSSWWYMVGFHPNRGRCCWSVALLLAGVFARKWVGKPFGECSSKQVLITASILLSYHRRNDVPLFALAGVVPMEIWRTRSNCCRSVLLVFTDLYSSFYSWERSSTHFHHSNHLVPLFLYLMQGF
jgi:hypothetical protein